MKSNKFGYFEHDQCFNGELDREEIRTAFTRWSSRYKKIAARAFDQRVASVAQMAAINSILGEELPTDAACCANSELLTFGFLRSVAGWRAILNSDRKLELRVMIYQADIVPDSVIDLREIKRDLTTRMKGRASAYVGRTLPFIGSGALGWHTIIIAAEGASSSSKGTRGKSVGAAPCVEIKLGRDEGRMAEACALQWGMQPLTSRKPNPDLVAEMFVNLALLRADRGMFGAEFGGKLAKSVMSEVRMRSRSFDLLDRAPIRGEQIPSILAALPADRDGFQMSLPSIINL